MFDTVAIGFRIFAIGTFSIPRFCSEMNCPIISSNSHVCQLTPLISFSRLRRAKHVFCKNDKHWFRKQMGYNLTSNKKLS